MRPALLFLLTAGCSPAAPSCPAGFIGDASKPPEAVMLVSDGQSQTFREVRDGDALPLMPPPQGGYVLYVGAKMRNMDACGIEQGGTLREPASGNQFGFDARTANMLLGSDGWGIPDVTSNADVSNVNACPDYGPTPVHGTSWPLELTLKDKGGRKVTVKHRVVPTCMHQNPLLQRDCVCTCSANYFLGKCSPDNADGGMRD